MRVSALVVVYGQWEKARRCVESLLESKGAEIIVAVVDNASPCPVPGWVEGNPSIRFERADRNLGFAGGMNRAFELIRSEGSPFVLIANSDTLFPDNTVEALAGLMDDQPRIGVAGPPVMVLDSPDTVWSAGGFLDPWRLRYEQRRWPSAADLPSRPVEVDMISGCALMVRSALFDELGGFREELFMYYEDADLCFRASQLGRRICLVPEGRVLHHVEASSRDDSPWLPEYYSRRNRLLLSARMQTSPQRLFFRPYMVVGTLLKTLGYVFRGRFLNIRWLWKALLDGLSGKSGYHSPGS